MIAVKVGAIITAAKKANITNSTMKTEIKELSREEISTRAYFIWEREGKPAGRAQEHWAKALAELRAEQKTLVASKGAPKRKAVVATAVAAIKRKVTRAVTPKKVGKPGKK